MSFNLTLAAALEQTAALLELTDANPFRVNALARAARVIEDLPKDLRTLAHDPAQLTAIDGIGKGIAEKIAEFAQTGRLTELDQLLAEVPPGLIEVMGVPGLGPKTIRGMWQGLGVTDLAGLRAAIDDGRLLTLPRMGEKAVAKIKANLAFAAEAGNRLHRGEALPVAEAIVAAMAAVPGVTRAAYAGSLRRGAETVGDVDVLVSTTDPPAAHAAFTAMAGVVQVITSGGTRSSVRVRLATDPSRWKGQPPEGGATVQVDLRVVPDTSWGAALMYFTGSKDHNVRLRERALSQGRTLNEYGLFPEDRSTTEAPHTRGVPAVAAAEECDVFAALGLPYLPPEVREDRGELALTATPRLVEVADIRAELHAHTTDSDGKMSLEQLVERAADRGFHTIAVTDHSRSSGAAGGLSVERLAEQRTRIEAHRAVVGDRITVLCGSEVDILADGRLDYDDDVLAGLDVVVASPHVSLDQDPAKATARLLRAIENPFVHVLGHPTGRLIQRRKGLAPAMAEIVAAAKQLNVALEVNAHWLRLDLGDTHVRAAVEAGCLIAINCDVHHPHDFDNLGHGVSTARRGWLTPDQCVNTWGRERLAAWLRKGRS